MGRTPTIDHDRVLDLAEDILLRSGTGALTMDAIARASGRLKSGIQFCSGTKNALIAAFMPRWKQDYEA